MRFEGLVDAGVAEDEDLAGAELRLVCADGDERLDGFVGKAAGKSEELSAIRDRNLVSSWSARLKGHSWGTRVIRT